MTEERADEALDRRSAATGCMCNYSKMSEAHN